MKKKLFILVLYFFLNTFLFSKDSDDLVLFLRKNCNLWKDYERANNLTYYDSFKLYDDIYLVIGNSSTIFTLFITDGESYSKSPNIGTQIDTSDTKYKINNIALFIADFDYDTNADLIGLCHDSGLGSTYLTIYSAFRDKPLLEIGMPNYALYEYKFSWITYCIVNGKRGIRIKTKGKTLEKKDYYSFVGDKDNYYFYEGKNENLAFFYWDKNEQRYILDESVTQEQLRNAYCPEDYFAYNGLQFSKLDSKLTEADLKDLDKAQLRLMRNAVYARHGRAFKSVDLQSLWECYTWYKKNPNYSDDLLTETDRHNIELIKRFE